MITREDEKFMEAALEEAKNAFKKNEVPIGAVLVKDKKIIGRGYNQVELLQDATAHAEMLCLTAGAEACQQWRLLESTLYCTLEPCAMCAGAMILARIQRLVWGAPDKRQGANGSWINLFSTPHPIHTINITPYVLAQPSEELMKTFFTLQRKRKGSDI